MPSDPKPPTDALPRHRLARWLARGLGSRWSSLVAVLAGVLFTLPSLAGGYQSEDWVFRGVSKLGAGLNLWGLPGPTPAELAERIANDRAFGFVPWITVDDFHVAFFRPLSALSHYLDYRVVDAPWFAHAQNVLLYAALVGAAAWLYRELVRPSWAAGLAAILYAIDDAHGHAVGWVSNRHALLGALFGVLALLAFHRWRGGGSRLAAALVPVTLGVALSCSEFALGAVAYLLCYSLFVDEAPRARRALAALVWLVPTLIWSIVRRALGYGVQGSGLYLDPITQPAAFLAHAPERGLALVSGQLGLIRAGAFTELGPLAMAGAGALVVLVLGAVLAVLLPVLRAKPLARFWALGSVLALVPVCGAFAEDRLLLLVGLGAFAVLAELVHAVGQASGVWRPGLGRPIALALAAVGIAVHAVVAPLLLPARTLTMARYDARLDAARQSAFALVSRPGQELVLLQAPDYYFGAMLLMVHLSKGHRAPLRTLVLAGTLDELDVTRVDPNTLVVSAARGLMPESFDRIYRGKRDPMAPGERINLKGAEAEVVQTSDGQPQTVQFRFSWPLQNDRFVFGTWRDGRYVRWPLPKVGARVVVRAR